MRAKEHQIIVTLHASGKCFYIYLLVILGKNVCLTEDDATWDS